MSVTEVLTPPHSQGPSPRFPHLVHRRTPLGRKGLGAFVLSPCLCPSLSHLPPPRLGHHRFLWRSGPSEGWVRLALPLDIVGTRMMMPESSFSFAFGLPCALRGPTSPGFVVSILNLWFRGQGLVPSTADLIGLKGLTKRVKYSEQILGPSSVSLYFNRHIMGTESPQIMTRAIAKSEVIHKATRNSCP